MGVGLNCRSPLQTENSVHLWYIRLKCQQGFKTGVKKSTYQTDNAKNSVSYFYLSITVHVSAI